MKMNLYSAPIIIENNVSKLQNGKLNCSISYLFQLAHHIYPISKHLSNHYIEEMISIAEKHVIRLDHSIKNQLCKKCHTLYMLSDKTEIVYNSERKKKWFQITCGECNHLFHKFKI